MSTPSSSAYVSNPFGLIRPSYDGVRRNLAPFLLMIVSFLGIALGLIIASAILLGLGSAIPGIGPVIMLILAAAAIIVLSIYLAPIPIALTLAMARGEEISFGALFKATSLRLGWRVVGTQVLMGLIVVGGLILFIIPGIIFSAWFMWAPVLVVDEDLAWMAALRRSRELTRGRIWDVLGTTALPGALGIFNLIPLLGFIVSIVFTFVLFPMGVVRYVQLKALKQAGDGHDVPTHPLNFVVILAFAVYVVVAGIVAAHEQPSSSTTPAGQVHSSPGNSYYLERK